MGADKGAHLDKSVLMILLKGSIRVAIRVTISLVAEYPSPKKVNLLNYGRVI